MQEAGHVAQDAPTIEPENSLAFKVWNLVADQATFYDKGKATMNLSSVCPVIALLGLPGNDSLELLGKIKTMRRIMNGETING